MDNRPSDDEILCLRETGLVIDMFSGGGGWTSGCEKSMGRPVDIALNHDPVSVAMHAMNHPKTVHLCQDVWQADPLQATRGRPVFHLHASPSCTQHSRARRALPAESQTREQAWRVMDWVNATNPLIVTIENVGEFCRWGPLGPNGRPIPERNGETFNEFVAKFRSKGYDIKWKKINAADYGAHTSRERLIIVARRDGLPIEWEEPTHGPGRAHSWKQAAEHIRWDVPAPSIFTRKKPLAPATMTRIMKGMRKHVINNPDPFYAPLGTKVGDGVDRADYVAAFMAQNHGLLPGRPATIPASTICSKGAGQGIVTASFVNVLRRNSVGTSMRDPINTICASGGHFAEVRVAAEPLPVSAYTIGYYSEGGGQHRDLRDPIGTLTTRDRMALILIKGTPHRLVDIGFRFLNTDELWPLQGFTREALGYEPILSPMINGKPLTGRDAKRLIGNSVVPRMAEVVMNGVLAPIDRLTPMRLAA